jgi:hypothetical protein
VATSTVTAFADVSIAVETSDGSDLPDGTRVCLDAVCQKITAALGIGGGRALFAGMIPAAMAPSGTSVTFTGIAVGSHIVHVRDASDTVLAAIAIFVSGETVNLHALMIPVTVPASPTPVTAATIAAPEPTAPVPTLTIVAPVPTTTSGVASPVVIPVATAPASMNPVVARLPNTGEGTGHGSGSPMWQFLAMSLLLIATGWRIRRRHLGRRY